MFPVLSTGRLLFLGGVSVISQHEVYDKSFHVCIGDIHHANNTCTLHSKVVNTIPKVYGYMDLECFRILLQNSFQGRTASYASSSSFIPPLYSSPRLPRFQLYITPRYTLSATRNIINLDLASVTPRLLLHPSANSTLPTSPNIRNCLYHLCPRTRATTRSGHENPTPKSRGIHPSTNPCITRSTSGISKLGLELLTRLSRDICRHTLSCKWRWGRSWCGLCYRPMTALNSERCCMQTTRRS